MEDNGEPGRGIAAAATAARYFEPRLEEKCRTRTTRSQIVESELDEPLIRIGRALNPNWTQHRLFK